MRLVRLNLGPRCDYICIATVPDSVRATFFMFSCISGTFEMYGTNQTKGCYRGRKPVNKKVRCRLFPAASKIGRVQSYLSKRIKFVAPT